ncbi:MAG TPA: TonB family protein [Burkholderiales bacterium]|nr:TonB family protein [Burkholderiales bacterium]
MSDIAIDSGPYLPSITTDWSRERPFKVAVVVSLLVHATLIAFVPGFRSVPDEVPRVLEVQIAPEQVPPPPVPVPRKPEIVPRQVEPEPQPRPVVREPLPETPPPVKEPVVQQPPPEPPPVPRANVIEVPRSEPKPDFTVPKPELRPEPKAEPKLEARPEPKLEPRREPAPVARVEPRPEPRPVPRIEPRPEPRPELRVAPRTDVVPEVKPIPREAAPPVAQRKAEPAAPVVAAPRAPGPAPAPSVAPPAPVAAAAPPVPADDGREKSLIEQYQQIIAARIKQFEEYPPVAKRRHWEGTTVVQLTLTPAGKVSNVEVVEKSGYDLLDEAAVKMIRKASPLPAPPEGLRGRDHTVLVPIRFKLES